MSHHFMIHPDVIEFHAKLCRINNFTISFQWFLSILKYYVNKNLTDEYLLFCSTEIKKLEDLSLLEISMIDIEELSYTSNIIFLQRGNYYPNETYIIIISHLYNLLANYYKYINTDIEEDWGLFRWYFSWIYEEIDDNAIKIANMIWEETHGKD